MRLRHLALLLAFLAVLPAQAATIAPVMPEPAWQGRS